MRQSLKDMFVDINDLSLFDVLHPSRAPKPDEPTFGDFGVQQISGLLEIHGKDIERGGQRYPALLSDSTLAQYDDDVFYLFLQNQNRSQAPCIP